jgi:hypothetical protein
VTRSERLRDGYDGTGVEDREEIERDRADPRTTRRRRLRRVRAADRGARDRAAEQPQELTSSMHAPMMATRYHRAHTE